MNKQLEQAIKALAIAEAKRDAAAKAMKENATPENIKAYEEAFDAYQKALDDKAKAEEEVVKENRENGKNPVEGKEQKEKKDMNEGINWVTRLREAVTAGTTFSGLIPDTIATEIVAKKNQISKLRGYCSVISGIKGTFSFAVEGNGVTVSYRSEGAAYVESNPTVKPVTLTARNLTALVKITNEALDRPAVDALAYVENLIAKGFAEREDEEILHGTGSTDSHITGIVTALEAASGAKITTAASATEITWAEVKSFLSSLKAYKANAIVVMSQATADLIQDFKDAAGHYIFQDQNADLARIKGVRVVISEAMDDIATGKVIMVAGDFSYYRIAEQAGMKIDIANELFRANGQKGVFADEYIDGNVALPDAFALFKMA